MPQPSIERTLLLLRTSTLCSGSLWYGPRRRTWDGSCQKRVRCTRLRVEVRQRGFDTLELGQSFGVRNLGDQFTAWTLQGCIVAKSLLEGVRVQMDSSGRQMHSKIFQVAAWLNGSGVAAWLRGSRHICPYPDCHNCDPLRPITKICSSTIPYG